MAKCKRGKHYSQTLVLGPFALSELLDDGETILGGVRLFAPPYSEIAMQGEELVADFECAACGYGREVRRLFDELKDEN